MATKGNERRKTGRNEQCPCGSGKKFKKCHGILNSLPTIPPPVRRMAAMQEAMHRQRQNQQGLGVPIISAQVGNSRIVAVRNRIFNSEKWKTFIDFLGDYIKTVIGADDWGNRELREKPLPERHPILQWYDKVCAQKRANYDPSAQIQSMPKTGALSAYYGLAYDLYCLDHNAELQTKLIHRLINHDNFYGARYEVAVAAILIRAGFTLEFQDENDRGSTHCEFTATSRATGRQFSVECKQRDAQPDGSMKLHKLCSTLRSALIKKAVHDRIVFMDLNFHYPSALNGNFPPQLDLAMRNIHKFESNSVNSGDLPPAFLFLTNYPVHHHLDDTNIGHAIMPDGFKIEEFKPGRMMPLHEAIVNRDKHKDIHDLLKSLKQYSRIPVTFDGDIPEFAFGDAQHRLLIGGRYWVTDRDGKERVGVITTAAMNVPEKDAYCGITLDNGESGIFSWPMSDLEMAAYEQHPDTFFGEISGDTETEDAIELYDFFLRTYSQSTREKLIEFFAGHPELEHLKTLNQSDLGKAYAEHCVSWAMHQQQSGQGS